jgi:hypothetical protein
MYYSEDNKKFSNRVDAIRYHILSGKQIFCYYYDDIYDKIDWTIEPQGTLDFHYKNQAQKIRDEYDYVILCYSGGFDSTNILETFHYNNIKLDKIVVQGPFKQDSFSGSDENQNGEIYENAFPYLNQLGLNGITQVIDNTELYGDITKFSIYEMGDDWASHIGARYSPHHFFWRDLDRYVVPKEYENKKVAIIWGTDKPYLMRSNGKTVFKFRDGVLTSYGRFNQPLRSNVTNINFYWDPNYPLILLKQLHTLKNYKSYFGRFDRYSISAILYNLKNNLNYASAKSPDIYVGLRDKFLFKIGESDILKFHQAGLKSIQDIDMHKFREIHSKEYAID